MKLPLISIITPTRNAGSTVEKVLLSVINQNYSSIEHLFVDGCSEDATTSIIRRYQQHFNHIRLISEQDNGLYDAINKGMDQCTGDWIYIMGADDEFHHDSLLTELAEQGLFQEEQIVYGNVLISGDVPWAQNNSIYDGPFTLEKLYMRNICHQSIFYPRSVLAKIGHYSDKYAITADWDYNIHCFARYRFIFTDAIIAIFHAGGKSSQEDGTSFFKDLPEKVIQYFNLDPEDQQLYKPDSPYYYPMSLYRENAYQKAISKAEAEIEKLRNMVSGHQAAIEEIQANFEKEQKAQLVKTNAQQEAMRASFETEQANQLAKTKAMQVDLEELIAQKESEIQKITASNRQQINRLNMVLAKNQTLYDNKLEIARRDITNLRTELAAHKKAIDSLVKSYTWKIGRSVTAPLRFFRKKP